MKEKIKEFFLSDSHKAYSFEELNQFFSNQLSSEEELAQILCELENEHFLMHNKKNEFATFRHFGLIYGTFTLKKEGFGFIDNDLDEHIYVAKKNCETILTGDIVVGSIVFGRSGDVEATINRIVKRANESFIGTIIFFNKKYYLDSNINYGANIIIDEENLNHAKVGDVVTVSPIQYYAGHVIKASVKNIIGKINSPFMDLKILAIAKGARTTFENDVIKESEALYKEEGIIPIGYLDKTKELVITIDGDDAKDFDDAVSLVKTNDHHYKLTVYIADVTHYVTEGSAIDLESLERGCSIYLPGMVIPMLPSVLSDDLCSLKEDALRLTLAVEMEFDESAHLLNHEIFNAVIKSRHRMTYNNCNKILNNEASIINKYPDLVEMLNNMADLAERLQYNRFENGAFDFGSAEEKVILDETGKVKDVVVDTRGISEGIIEEFMIATNTVIATDFKYLEVPFLYRVHPVPEAEKVSKMLLKLSAIGYNINNKKNKKHLNYLLKDIIKDNDIYEENISAPELTKRITINNELIRSMSKALYQETNIGHFGLALEDYTHFTSPIRRYPDLIVHRLVKTFLLNQSTKSLEEDINYYKKIVNIAGATSSKQERLAESIERDAKKYKECEYMENYIGEKLDGTISSITSFGIFVSLDNLIEGLSRYSDMRGYFEYDENLSIAYNEMDDIKYQIGDRVKIRVTDVDKTKRMIDFKILRKE